MFNLIIPIYLNKQNIEELIKSLVSLNIKLDKKLFCTFVIDGSPDKSYEYICKYIKFSKLKHDILIHSRNYGSFAAIRSGLTYSKGKYFAVMSADLQEPISLIEKFFKTLSSNNYDILVGVRKSRNDPFLDKFFSNIYWFFYRKFINQDIPKGGVDVFACNEEFKNHLVSFSESRSSLIALIYWLGFRRKELKYSRQARIHGKSSWTFKKKISYMADSLFSFSSLPISVIIFVGFFGSILLIIASLVIFYMKMKGLINISGYTTIILTIMLLGAVNLFSIGIVGAYCWRAYENSKNRPQAILINSNRDGFREKII